MRDPRSAGTAAGGPGVSRSVATRRPQHRERSASGHLAGQQTSSTAATRLPRPMRAQEGSRSNSSSALNGRRHPASAAAIDSRLRRDEKPRDPVSNASRRPASAALAFSRPKGPVEHAEERRAARLAAMGPPARNRASDCAAAGVLSRYRRRISGAILEENGEAEQRSSTLSPLSRTRSENVRWSDPGRRRAPGHARAPTIHSQHESIVIGSAATTRRRVSAPATVPKLPTLQQAAPQAQVATYMDMHHVYERAPACKPYVPLMDFGANYSQNSDGTTLRDIQRRAEAMRTKFPVPANATASARRGRQFAGQAFVDVPGTVGSGSALVVAASAAGRERSLPVEGAERNLNGEIQGIQTVHWGSTASSPARDGNETAEEKKKKKKKKKGKWKRFSGFVANKLGKGKRSSSSDPSSDASRTPSTRPQLSIAIPQEVPEPVSPISADTWARLEGRDRELDHLRRVSSLSSSQLNGIYEGVAEDDNREPAAEPAAKPAPVPAPARAAPVPAPVLAAPVPEQSAPSLVEEQPSTEADMMSLFSEAQAQAPYHGHELMEFEEDDVSALRQSDPDAFPSALNEQERWARPQAPVPLSAEEMAEGFGDEAGWTGAQSQSRPEGGEGVEEEAQILVAQQAVRVGNAKLVDIDEPEIHESQQATNKGKARLVDNSKSRIPKRYRGRRQHVARAPASEEKGQEAKEGEADEKPDKTENEGSLASDADADAKSWKTADILNIKVPMLVVSVLLPDTTGSQRNG